MRTNTLKFRHELKYYITEADYLTLRSRLSRVADPDPYAGPDGTYVIRSLYFDTPGDKALQEKLTGVQNREKFRIRLYNGDDSFIRLEKKMKITNSTAKITCTLSREETERILAGDIAWMCGDERELLTELYMKMKYQQLRPKTIVDYSRECFIYRPGNVRISIDSQIKTGITSTKLFDQNLPMTKAFGIPVIIMEVKFDQYLPSIIKAMIQLPNRRVTAFSKYASARMYG
ncbi:MAG TPA: polyphosphate polymerase domain-containing protein [Methanocorpusculum sp.]|nr:polyphosphate polymerase domain-containing protein [Methanocorpusculum sp.]